MRNRRHSRAFRIRLSDVMDRPSTSSSIASTSLQILSLSRSAALYFQNPVLFDRRAFGLDGACLGLMLPGFIEGSLSLRGPREAAKAL